MDVLIIEPEKAPRRATIDGSLESLQGIVGGYIQAVYPFKDSVALVCNDEGKLLGLPLNRSLEDYDVIAGTFLICGLGREDFCSLSPELADKYAKKFQDPEQFIHLGGRCLSFPIKPRDEPVFSKPRRAKSSVPYL